LHVMCWTLALTVWLLFVGGFDPSLLICPFFHG
jgi:hypothetical protein